MDTAWASQVLNLAATALSGRPRHRLSRCPWRKIEVSIPGDIPAPHSFQDCFARRRCIFHERSERDSNSRTSVRRPVSNRLPFNHSGPPLQAILGYLAGRLTGRPTLAWPPSQAERTRTVQRYDLPLSVRSGIRTHTAAGLNRVPPTVGLPGHDLPVAREDTA